MKHPLLFLAVLTLGTLHAADDPFVAVESAISRNQLAEAERLLAPVLATHPSDARAAFNLSMIRARERKTKEALALAEKAVAGAPNEARYHSHLGAVIGQRMGEVSFFQQAMLAGRLRDAFQRAIELDPEHVPGYLGLARFYTNAPAIAGGGREPAERYAREAEKRDRRAGRLELANIAEHFDDLTQAYELYTQAAADQPKAAWLQETLGRIAERRQQPLEARQHFETALALDPRRKNAREALARLAAPAVQTEPPGK